jgi:hypothetical protein
MYISIYYVILDQNGGQMLQNANSTAGQHQREGEMAMLASNAAKWKLHHWPTIL